MHSIKKSNNKKTNTKTIVLFFVMLITLPFSKLLAQPWCNTGAVWHYDFMNGSPAVGFVKITYQADTTIDGFSCQKLSKFRKTYNYINEEVTELNFGAEITRLSNNVVLIKNQTLWDTLYNFNANPGQSWRVTTVNQTSGSETCGKNANISVLDTGHLTINGIWLRYLKVAINLNEINTMPPISEYQDTIFERIGFKKYYLLPLDNCLSMIDANEGGFLRCFSDNTLGLFQPEFSSDCTFLPTFIDEYFSQNKSNPLKINIEHNSLNILNKDLISSNNLFCIYNLNGQLMINTNTVANGIDLSNLQSGMYLLRVIANEKNYTQKFVLVK
jgi:hypothetical protein